MKKEIAQNKNYDELLELARDTGKNYFRQGLTAQNVC